MKNFVSMVENSWNAMKFLKILRIVMIYTLRLQMPMPDLPILEIYTIGNSFNLTIGDKENRYAIW